MAGRISSFIDAWKSIFIGHNITAKRLRAPRVTEFYPYEKPQLAERWRGAPMLKGVMGESTETEKFPNVLGEFNATIEDRDKDGKLPPCVYSCPAHVDARGYVELIAEGRFKDALDLIRERCTLPAAIGRVCTRPCEEGCRRNFFDEPISIRDLKRFAADECMDMPHPEPIAKTKNKKIGIIGAGPAGLTAAQVLAKQGYYVTVYDKNPQGGGTLLTGIPKYRLPKDKLKWDVDAVCALGVELKTNVEVGKDIQLSELISSYDAVLIATGLPAGWDLGIEGEDAEGVWGCLDLLKEMNFDNDPKIGKSVAVVGGGNVAMDGARTSLRLGAEKVYLVYRRGKTEMPARYEEIYESEEEGIIFELLTNPKRVIVENGKVAGLECIRMGLGEPDASGRRRPEPIPGSEFILDVDTVVTAIGQKTDLSFLEGTGIQLNDRGVIVYDKLTLQTSNPKVFTAGEVVTGAGAAIQAIASGHEAAESLDRFLRGIDLKDGRTARVVPKPYNYPQVYMDWVEPNRRRTHMAMIPLEERLKGFAEVELGFTKEEAIREANRCLVCNNGNCSGCTMCARTCPVHCIEVERTGPQETERKVLKYDLDLTKCMVCGLCAEVCPTKALVMSKDYENAEFIKEKLFYDKEHALRR
ncbi:MAG TPA: FAD-dependent oxidoreductase [Anaerolineae bacterium]|jgi:NADPH-dependent glutamate synthase beta subunit-like oxidoreductase|nr:FAD-dependent oxidoreductase [Anaerolineae bacterium]